MVCLAHIVSVVCLLRVWRGLHGVHSAHTEEGDIPCLGKPESKNSGARRLLMLLFRRMLQHK